VSLVALLLTALATAYGAAVVIRARLRPAATVLALALYLLAGLEMALLVTLGNGGVLLPGRQINPAIIAEWQQVLAGTPLLSPWLVLLAVPAHGLVLIGKPGRGALLGPLPATLVLVALLIHTKRGLDRGPSHVVAGIGPDRIAYLTTVPGEDGAVRMLFADGLASDALFGIRYVHDSGGAPPSPQLVWTRDGQVLVFRSRTRGLMALGLDGAVIGHLPVRAADWPQEDPNHESVAARREFSLARKQVDEFVREHGGFYVSPE